MQGGYVGVDVFFVLSGFLITGLLLSGAANAGYSSLGNFYVRRARRILPAAALVLVTTDIVAYHVLNFVRAKQVISDSLWASFFAANVRFESLGTDYFAQELPPSPVQHFWSLAVEEQFYLVWPLLLLLVVFGIGVSGRARRGSAAVVSEWGSRRLLAVAIFVAVASFVWSIYETNARPAAAYFSPFTRAWELALGAVLAVATPKLMGAPGAIRLVSGWLGLAGILIAGMAFSASTPMPGYAALLPTLGAALVIWAGTTNHRSRVSVSRLLSLRPLGYVGDRSYGFYLWHWPVLIIAVAYAGHELAITLKLLLVLAAFTMSVVMYRFYENPIRRAKRPVFNSLLAPATIGVAVVVAVFSLGLIDSEAARLRVAAAAAADVAAAGQSQVTAATGTGSTLPAVAAAVIAGRNGAPIPSGLKPPVGGLLSDFYRLPDGCAASDGATTSQICRLGDTSGTKKLVVIGDSHAMMWLPTILSFAERDGWVVIPLTKSGCTPNRWIATAVKFNPLAECRPWYRWVIKQAKALHPDATLITGSMSDPKIAADSDLRVADGAAMRATVKALRPFSKRVVVIGDPPTQTQEPVDCLLARKATMARCTAIVNDDQLFFYEQIGQTVKTAGGRFIDTAGWFCFLNRCPMVVGKTITRRDLAHISTTYGLQLGPPFRAAFRQAVGNA
jgi:peptidoglycan/LPS O-acetylase OafA/YrhL